MGKHKKMFGTKVGKENGEPQDPCKGDGGGPLMSRTQDSEGQHRWVIIGTLFGAGYDCKTGEKGGLEGTEEGIWNKVSAHTKWILGEVQGGADYANANAYAIATANANANGNGNAVANANAKANANANPDPNPDPGLCPKLAIERCIDSEPTQCADPDSTNCYDCLVSYYSNAGQTYIDCKDYARQKLGK